MFKVNHIGLISSIFGFVMCSLFAGTLCLVGICGSGFVCTYPSGTIPTVVALATATVTAVAAMVTATVGVATTSR